MTTATLKRPESAMERIEAGRRVMESAKAKHPVTILKLYPKLMRATRPMQAYQVFLSVQVTEAGYRLPSASRAGKWYEVPFNLLHCHCEDHQHDPSHDCWHIEGLRVAVQWSHLSVIKLTAKMVEFHGRPLFYVACAAVLIKSYREPDFQPEMLEMAELFEPEEALLAA